MAFGGSGGFRVALRGVSKSLSSASQVFQEVSEVLFGSEGRFRGSLGLFRRSQVVSGEFSEVSGVL